MTTLLSLCGVRAQAADPRTGGEIPTAQVRYGLPPHFIGSKEGGYLPLLG